jgi:hypothetical protein
MVDLSTLIDIAVSVIKTPQTNRQLSHLEYEASEDDSYTGSFTGPLTGINYVISDACISLHQSSAELILLSSSFAICIVKPKQVQLFLESCRL